MIIDKRLFLDEAHEERFKRLVFLDETYPDDAERIQLFYILAGNSDIRSKPHDAYYDFKEHHIKRTGMRKYVLCSSAEALLRMAFNLYNSLNKSKNVYESFFNLDDKNFRLAINALKIRFRKL